MLRPNWHPDAKGTMEGTVIVGLILLSALMLLGVSSYLNDAKYKRENGCYVYFEGPTGHKRAGPHGTNRDEIVRLYKCRNGVEARLL